MPTPDISFVVTAFQSDLTLASCLRSIATQAGGSETIECVLVIDEPWSERHNWLLTPEFAEIKLLTPGHVGRSQALNLGVGASNSPLVAILDADDECLPRRVSLQTAYLKERPHVDVLGGQMLQHGTWGSRVSDGWPTRSSDIDDRLAKGRMPLAHPAMTYRRDWFDKTGGYEPSALRCEDFDLVLRGWNPGRYRALRTVVTRYRTSTRFPNWDYWRTSELYRHAVVARHRLESGELVLNRRLRLQTLGGDASKWIAQSSLDRLRG